jgi:hypothetical protein
MSFVSKVFKIREVIQLKVCFFGAKMRIWVYKWYNKWEKIHKFAQKWLAVSFLRLKLAYNNGKIGVFGSRGLKQLTNSQLKIIFLGKILLWAVQQRLIRSPIGAMPAASFSEFYSDYLGWKNAQISRMTKLTRYFYKTIQ